MQRQRLAWDVCGFYPHWLKFLLTKVKLSSCHSNLSKEDQDPWQQWNQFRDRCKPMYTSHVVSFHHQRFDFQVYHHLCLELEYTNQNCDGFEQSQFQGPLVVSFVNSQKCKQVQLGFSVSRQEKLCACTCSTPILSLICAKASGQFIKPLCWDSRFHMSRPWSAQLCWCNHSTLYWYFTVDVTHVAYTHTSDFRFFCRLVSPPCHPLCKTNSH